MASSPVKRDITVSSLVGHGIENYQVTGFLSCVKVLGFFLLDKTRFHEAIQQFLSRMHTLSKRSLNRGEAGERRNNTSKS